MFCEAKVYQFQNYICPSNFTNSCVNSVLLMLSSTYSVSWKATLNVSVSKTVLIFLVGYAVNLYNTRLQFKSSAHRFMVENVKSLLLICIMKNFNFNINSCTYLARWQISFSFPWSFESYLIHIQGDTSKGL